MGKINIQGVKAGGKIIAKRLNLKPAWDTIEINETPFENEAFSVFVGATDPDTFPDPDLTYSVSGGSLPSGLSINSSTGEISGTVDPVESDTPFNFTLRAADGPLGPEQQGKAVDRNFSITILNNEPPSFDQVADFSIGSVAELAAASLFQITASDPNTNPQAITFTEVGANLAVESLSLDSSGNVTGTPPDAGGTRVVTFTVRADDGVLTTDQAYKLTITDSQDPIWVTDAGALASGSTNVEYSETVVATDDNTIAYSITSGALPAGLSLNSSTGDITGTPTTNESASFEVTATDTIESDFTAQSFSIEISLTIENSLRFNDDDSAFTSWTPGVAQTDTDIGTISLWFKLGNLSLTRHLFNAGTSNEIRLDNTNHLQVVNAGDGVGNLVTTQLFRDPSAWYHVVVAYDTGQGTEANRVKIYLNGTQITVFNTEVYPAQNNDLSYFKNGQLQTVGANELGASEFDGYMSEVIGVDGQQLTASDFGLFDANGDWQPKSYSGSFGTNGFHLDFAVAPGTGDGGGTDVSGNDNHFSDSGLAANDQMTDSPTNNFPTFTLIDHRTVRFGGNGQGTPVLRNGNLQAEMNISTLQPAIAYYTTFQDAPVTGQVYFEFKSILRTNQPAYPNVLTNGSGRLTTNTGNVIGFALNFDTGETWYHINGTWNNGVGIAGAPDGTFSIGAPFTCNTRDHGSTTSKHSLNFGQHAFAFPGSVPSGYGKISSAILATPTIANPSDYFDTLLYIGDGAAGEVKDKGAATLAFQPDMIWLKNRGNTFNHVSYDSVRGATKRVELSVSAPEATLVNAVSSFNADGFSVGGADGTTNQSGFNIVAWNWLAGTANSGSTSGAGVLKSFTESFNATNGFSIITYEGNGSAGHTIPHSLGVAPQFYVVKGRNTSSTSWQGFHINIGATKSIKLDQTAAPTTSTVFWNDTAPDEFVFTLGTSNGVNEDAKDFVAYLWSEIEGFSKFGSYTGNGSTDGIFTWCGFRPAYVLIKKTNNTSAWLLYDNRRLGYNVNNNRSALEDNLIEGSSVEIDLLSNGFKLRTSTGGNGDGDTYIFAAFAESPFKTARAR